ncbi:hypothetical protein P171DRAFT_443922 [Karstenula rhodostoma CBS 690.94]|uniref:Uncharacterized protein n=1 Tax=Karstenula rhodostoma CBS 690.94 TaxID=1392251 RepID=A0A9P4PKT3_9PLEO|nr:hypothetical protein P171DRAFT_443922 [Karstenula rhodostoma CBS 690.94]
MSPFPTQKSPGGGSKLQSCNIAQEDDRGPGTLPIARVDEGISLVDEHKVSIPIAIPLVQCFCKFPSILCSPERSNEARALVTYCYNPLTSEHFPNSTQSSRKPLTPPTINHELAVRLAKLHLILAEIRLSYDASRKLIKLMHDNEYFLEHPKGQEYMAATTWQNNHFAALIQTIDRDGAYFSLPDSPFDVLVSTIENSGRTLRIFSSNLVRSWELEAERQRQERRSRSEKDAEDPDGDLPMISDVFRLGWNFANAVESYDRRQWWASWFSPLWKASHGLRVRLRRVAWVRDVMFGFTDSWVNTDREALCGHVAIAVTTMPFTAQDFLESAAQIKKVTHRQPSFFRGDDGCQQQSSATPSPLSSASSSVLSSVPLPLLSLETRQHTECRKSCRHRSCRTFRPAHAETLGENEPPRPIALNHLSINQLFNLHKKLESLQESVDATEQIIKLCRARLLKFHPATEQRYIRTGSQRRKDFEHLLTEIRCKNAYFGHIGLPERLDFVDAVATSGLTHEQVSLQHLLIWNDVAESLRKDARNNSEYNDEDTLPDEIRDVGFKPGWSFESASARGGGEAVDEEEIAPDETADESRRTKRARSLSPDVLNEKVARARTAEGLLANY